MDYKLSIIIPSYKDPFLPKTIASILENTALDDSLEIIPVQDGYFHDDYFQDVEDSICNVHDICLEKSIGMRGAINEGLKVAKGEFVMKCDSHCCFGPGFDEILVNACQENWLVIPRRYSLNDETWDRQENRPIRDYHYFGFPTWVVNYGCGLHPQEWNERTRERWNGYDIDDTMTFQGSCWLANRDYFMKHVGYLDDDSTRYGTFAQESTEIGCKYWLGGGAVKVVKTAWYAHLSKRKKHYDMGMFHKGYKTSRATQNRHTWSAMHWMNNEEPGMIHPFSWLVEKFWPIPTWDINWQEKWDAYSTV